VMWTRMAQEQLYTKRLRRERVEENAIIGVHYLHNST
jgi:hypothetical protein